MIYLTAIGLTPGGSNTVHIYTQNSIQNNTNKQYVYIEQHIIDTKQYMKQHSEQYMEQHAYVSFPKYAIGVMLTYILCCLSFIRNMTL
jgi:hypothetical protein